MKKIDALEIQENLIKLIGKDWMLISAGDKDNYNTMTASWGFMGYFSNKPTAVILVRPERYTTEFIESKERFTLSFFAENYRKALSLLGTKSGRDGDKIGETGLNVTFTENGNPTFSEARIVMECRKLFVSDMKGNEFIDKSLIEAWYNPKKGNFHRLYMAEIEGVYIEE